MNLVKKILVAGLVTTTSALGFASVASAQLIPEGTSVGVGLLLRVGNITQEETTTSVSGLDLLAAIAAGTNAVTNLEAKYTGGDASFKAFAAGIDGAEFEHSLIVNNTSTTSTLTVGDLGTTTP